MEVRRISVSIRGLGKGIIKASGLICLWAGLWVVNPMDSQAAVKQAEVQTRSSYVVKIEAPAVDVHRSASEGSSRQGQVMRGQTYEVLGRTEQGWVKIRTGGREGYIKTSGNATVVEKAHETVDEDAKMRRQVVEYALQFVGGRYQYGGVGPNKGVGINDRLYQIRAGQGCFHQSSSFVHRTVLIREGCDRGPDAAGRPAVLRRRRGHQPCGPVHWRRGSGACIHRKDGNQDVPI